MVTRKQADSSKKKDSAAPKKKAIRTDDGAIGGGREVWSKSKKKRMRQLKARQKKLASEDDNVVINEKSVSAVEVDNTESVRQQAPHPSSGALPAHAKTSELQKSFLARLTGSRFRELNEVRLYDH